MTPEPTPDPIDETITLLHDVVRLMQTSLAHHQEVADIPPGQVRAMRYLYQRGRCSIGELATGIGVGLPAASELVDRLVDAGWVERGVNPEDRRQTHVWLTPSALEVGRRIKAMRRAQVEAAFGRLDAADVAPFLRGLRALTGSLSESSCLETSSSKR